MGFWKMICTRLRWGRIWSAFSCASPAVEFDFTGCAFKRAREHQYRWVVLPEAGFAHHAPGCAL